MTLYILRKHDQCNFKQTLIFETKQALLDYCEICDIETEDGVVTDGDYYSTTYDNVDDVRKLGRTSYERTDIENQLYVIEHCDEMRRRMPA